MTTNETLTEQSEEYYVEQVVCLLLKACNKLLNNDTTPCYSKYFYTSIRMNNGARTTTILKPRGKKNDIGIYVPIHQISSRILVRNNKIIYYRLKCSVCVNLKKILTYKYQLHLIRRENLYLGEMLDKFLPKDLCDVVLTYMFPLLRF